MRTKTLIVFFVVVAVILGFPIWAQEGMTLAGSTDNHVAAEALYIALNDHELEVDAVAVGPNDDGRAFILVAVTFEGAGVHGLIMGNFTLGTHVVRSDEPRLEIERLVPLGDGKYRLHVVPTQNQQWTLGRSLLSVKVDLRPLTKASGMTVVALDVATPGVGPTPIITSVQPVSSGTRDPIALTITITGFNFQSGAMVGFTPGGILLDSTTVQAATQITIVIRIDVSVVAPQEFDITVINPDGGQDTLPSAFTVT